MKKSVLLEFEEYEKLVEENKRLTKIAEDRTSVLEIHDYVIFYCGGGHAKYPIKIFTFKGKKEFKEIVTEINNNFAKNISKRMTKEASFELDLIKKTWWYKFFGGNI